MKITIIGIGQTMRNDDSAGLIAVQHWQATFPHTSQLPSITIVESELPGLELLNLLEGYDAAILVDAVKSSASPGTIHRLTETDILGFAEDHPSAHGWGIAETLQLGRKLEVQIPKIIHLIGIEGENFSMGRSLSPQVLLALDEAAQFIEDSVKIILKQA
jgi:hydrogenase maturation protease